MEEKEIIGECFREENMFGDESPIDCPFIEELTGEIECRDEIRFGEVRSGDREERE
jgi:hypothetical protein